MWPQQRRKAWLLGIQNVDLPKQREERASAGRREDDTDLEKEKSEDTGAATHLKDLPDSTIYLIYNRMDLNKLHFETVMIFETEAINLYFL